MCGIPSFRAVARCRFRGAGCLIVWLLATATWAADQTSRTRVADAPGWRAHVHYTTETRQEPRALRLHVLRVDLQAEAVELAVAVGERPVSEAGRQAEAVLTHPRELAENGRMVAAVNTNPWFMVPERTDGFRTPYVAGLACHILGWVVSDGQVRSTPRTGNWNFWIDSQRQAGVGPSPGKGDIRQAVAGFGGLVQAGTVLPSPSHVRHPRTALGLDRHARWLTLAVVDGRQEGFSEGMSERELAEWMVELGCWHAINLDGGGSSILLLDDEHGELQIRNRPSPRLRPRPVPVMLGVRARGEPDP